MKRKKPAAAPPPSPKDYLNSPDAATEFSQSTGGLPPDLPVSQESANDDEFFKSIKLMADNASKRKEPEKAQGFVLVKDADGFERMMDARFVSDNSVIVQAHKDVKCPGCGEWFREEKLSCPTCFRENYQGTGGWRRIKHQNLRSLAKVGFILTLGGISYLIYLLVDLFHMPSLPIEIQMMLWIALPFLVTGGAMLIKRSVSS